MTPSAITDFRAFILAAGEGTRLRPYTDDLPKPLVEVAGKPLLGHILEHLVAAGVQKATINSFYKKEKIRAFTETYGGPLALTLSEEDTLLNTGLGIKNALETMGGKPFFAVNGDAFWQDGPGGSVFIRLLEAWNPERMDILLLLQPVKNMHLTKGIGDYSLEADGRARRDAEKQAEYMFAGVRLCTPEIFKDTPDTPFGFLDLMDRAEKAGRLYALIHDGDWHHISTPEDLENVEKSVKDDT